ncbi:MAG: UvrD-helicase domain-containing protein [Myxococcota bacterium]
MSWLPKPDFLHEPRQGDLVVEASAGTGKTFTIEHLVLDAVLGGLLIEEILVITFTEKAAAELAHRLRGLFARASEQALARPPPGPAWRLDDTAQDRLRAARLGLARARISTIHGFCQRVGSEQGLLSGRPFEQVLVSESLVFEHAFRRVVHGASSKPALASWLAAWTRRAPLAKLESRAKAVWNLGAEVSPSFAPAAWTEAWSQILTVDRSAWIRRAAEGPGRLRGGTAKLLRWLADAPGPEQGLVDAPDGWTKLARELAPLLPEPGPLDRLRASWAPPLPALLHVLRPELFVEAEGLKGDHSWQTYDDMVHKLDAGLDDPELRAQVRAQIRLALVDEFQDTDSTQWRILQRLFEGHCPLILVGDPKQSIYGFRGADVGVFGRAIADLTKADRLALDRCHRSTPELIRCINAAFAPGGILRGMEHRPVTSARAPALGLRRRGRLLPPVRLLPVELECAPVRQVRRQWARAVVRHVVELLDGGVTRADDAPLQPEDVFVLCRTTQEGRSIAEQLREARVPVQLFEREGVLRGPEAGLVLDLLRGLVDPDRSGPAARAWLTPFFGLEPAQLAHVRDLASDHPLVLDLRTWSELARRRDWGGLFRRLLDAATPRCRAAPERWGAIEAQRRIMAELGALVRRRGASLEELIRWLEEGLGGEGAEPSETKGAVRVSTMHAAKGLESEVVVLFGGLGRPRRPMLPHRTPDGVWRVHAGGEVPPEAEAQAEAEEERLLYVALTRARSLLVLPRFDAEPEGPIRHLMRGLVAIEDLPKACETPALPEAKVHPRPGPEPAAPWPTIEVQLGRFETSFSDLKRRTSQERDDPVLDRPSLEPELPGGAGMGRCLHGLLERGQWGAWSTEEIEEALEQEGLPRHHGAGVEALLTRTVQRGWALPGRSPFRLLDGHRHIRELDFTWYQPGASAFIRGFVDLVLELDDGVWVLDYKSDVLPDYEAEHLDQHVREAYGLQADLYAAAVQAHLAQSRSEAKVRGVAYLFLRSEPKAEDQAHGLWARRLDGGESERVSRALKERGHVRAR